MKRSLFIGGFGLLPLWTAIVIVIIGSYQSNNPNYWAVAPWLIVVSVPLSAVTLVIAFTTLFIYGRTTGEPSRKRRVAFRSFVGMVALVVIIAGVLRLESNKRQQDMANEEQHALEFVRNNSEVLEAAGSYEEVDLMAKSMSRGMPSRYQIAIRNRARTLIAIVDVSRPAGNTTFVLACITTFEAIRDRDLTKSRDECEP